MTVNTEELPDIDDLRQEIDRLDAEILAAVQRRREPLLVLEAADAIRARARQQGYSEREVLTVLTNDGFGGFSVAQRQMFAGAGAPVRLIAGPPDRTGVVGRGGTAADERKPPRWFIDPTEFGARLRALTQEGLDRRHARDGRVERWIGARLVGAEQHQVTLFFERREVRAQRVGLVALGLAGDGGHHAREAPEHVDGGPASARAEPPVVVRPARRRRRSTRRRSTCRSQRKRCRASSCATFSRIG